LVKTILALTISGYTLKCLNKQLLAVRRFIVGCEVHFVSIIVAAVVDINPLVVVVFVEVADDVVVVVVVTFLLNENKF
jgi:hypothetical protein